MHQKRNGKALYVEIDKYAAAWIENLIAAGHICPGEVFCGDMRDVTPADCAQYSQVHLFAGIAVWSYGIRRAGISDSANIWTFSEPCQPFSAAGKRLGFADERYLRPYTHFLVEQCRPDVCLGEQVASNDGLAWFDVVQADMERAGYAIGASDTCSAGFGAPHIRQRLRFAAVRTADATDCDGGCGERGTQAGTRTDEQRRFGHSGDGAVGGLADDVLQQRPHGQPGISPEHDASGWNEGPAATAGLCSPNRLADTWHVGRGKECADTGGFAIGDRTEGRTAGFSTSGSDLRPGPTNGFWRNADWLFCRDGKWRAVEPGTFPLAHGATSRVGRLRAYGNAVDGEATTEFCRAVAAVIPGLTAHPSHNG